MTSYNAGGILILALTSLFALGVSASASRDRGDRVPHPEYTIGKNVEITVAQRDRRHYEAYIAAAAAHAEELIACDYVLRGAGDSDDLFYISRDSGATWKLALTMPHFTDPSCAIGTDGTLFAAGASNGAKSTLGVMRSADGGRNWAAAQIPALEYEIDRPYVTVDGTGSAAAIIVHAYRFSDSPPAAALFFVSHDDGRSFSPPIVRAALEYTKPWFFVGNGATTRAWAYYALFVELDRSKKHISNRTDPASAPSSVDAQLELYRSDDHGGRFTLAGTIRGVYYDWRAPQISMPSLAIDQSAGPHRNRIYVVWPDARFGRHTSILLAFSDNRGRTWSAPQVISGKAQRNGSNEPPNDFMPMVAVNKDGVVGVSWYDRRNSRNNLSYDVRFVASVNGGRTWLPSICVSDSPYVPGKDTRYNGGDTAGLAADAEGVFHPAWIANPSGLPAMWTASVGVHSGPR